MKKTLFILLPILSVVFLLGCAGEKADTDASSRALARSTVDSDGNIRRNLNTSIKQALVDTQYPFLYSGDGSVDITGNKASDYGGSYPVEPISGAQRKEFKITIADGFKPPTMIGSFVVNTGTSSMLDDDYGRILGITSVESINIDHDYFDFLNGYSGYDYYFLKGAYFIDFNVSVSIKDVFIKYTRIDGGSSNYSAKMDDIQVIYYSGNGNDNIGFGVENNSDDVKTAKILVTMYYIAP